MSYSLPPIYRPDSLNTYKITDRKAPHLKPHMHSLYSDLNEFTHQHHPTRGEMLGFGNFGNNAGYNKHATPDVYIDLAYKQQLQDDEEATQQIDEGRPVIDDFEPPNPDSTVFSLENQDPQVTAEFRAELQEKKSRIMSLRVRPDIKQMLLSEAYKTTFAKYFMNNIVQTIDPLSGKPINNRMAQIQASNPFASGELPNELDMEDYNNYVDQKTEIQAMMRIGENEEYKQEIPADYPLEEFKNPVLTEEEQERYDRWMRRKRNRERIARQETNEERRKRETFDRMMSQHSKAKAFKALKELFEKKNSRR